MPRNTKVEKLLKGIKGAICENGSQAVVDKLQELIDLTLLKDELITQFICDLDGNTLGTITIVRDEIDGTLTEAEIYTDENGAITATKPVGTICNGKVDFEFKYLTEDKCLVSGENIKEVLCLTYKDGVEVSAVIFWIVNGTKVDLDPGATDCTDCELKGSQGTIMDWNF